MIRQAGLSKGTKVAVLTLLRRRETRRLGWRRIVSHTKCKSDVRSGNRLRAFLQLVTQVPLGLPSVWDSPGIVLKVLKVENSPLSQSVPWPNLSSNRARRRLS